MQDNLGFSDSVNVEKKLSRFDVVEGKQVPIIHTWGYKNLTEKPKEDKSNPYIRPYLTSPKDLVKNLREKLGMKISGLPQMPNLNEKVGFYAQTLIVEKYKEIYYPGIGNDAIHKLNMKGYNYKQIAQKLGRCALQSIEIAHGHPKLYPLNVMLNEGVDIIWDLITELNATDYFTNALARVGVGTGTSAANATQTELQGASTLYKAMEATFPLSTTAQRVDFKSSFGSAEANFAWEEFTVDNSAATSDNLNRVVSSKGTKVSGETWTAEMRITGS